MIPTRLIYAALLLLAIAAPAVVYPVFLMKALCLALFALSLIHI